jgi:hypothetical protein
VNRATRVQFPGGACRFRRDWPLDLFYGHSHCTSALACTEVQFSCNFVVIDHRFCRFFLLPWSWVKTTNTTNILKSIGLINLRTIRSELFVQNMINAPDIGSLICLIRYNQLKLYFEKETMWHNLFVPVPSENISNSIIHS